MVGKGGGGRDLKGGWGLVLMFMGWFVCLFVCLYVCMFIYMGLWWV